MEDIEQHTDAEGNVYYHDKRRGTTAWSLDELLDAAENSPRSSRHDFLAIEEYEGESLDGESGLTPQTESYYTGGSPETGDSDEYSSSSEDDEILVWSEEVTTVDENNQVHHHHFHHKEALRGSISSPHTGHHHENRPRNNFRKDSRRALAQAHASRSVARSSSRAEDTGPPPSPNTIRRRASIGEIKKMKGKNKYRRYLGRNASMEGPGGSGSASATSGADEPAVDDIFDHPNTWQYYVYTYMETKGWITWAITILILADVYLNNKYPEPPPWVTSILYSISGVFFVDVCFRFWCFTTFEKKWRVFFKDMFHIIDVTVVAIDLISIVMSLFFSAGGSVENASAGRALRFLRFGRFLRALRVMKLKSLMDGGKIKWSRLLWGDPFAESFDTESKLFRAVPVDAMLALWSDIEERKVAVFDYIITLIFFALFVSCILNHHRIDLLYQMEDSVLSRLVEAESDAGLTFHEIEDRSQAYEWIETRLIPEMFVQVDLTGRQIDQSDWGYFGSYNRIIAFSIGQTRSETKDCFRGFKDYTDVYGECHPTSTTSLEEFGLPACNSSANTFCYNTSEYQSVVDTRLNEGFKYRDYGVQREENYAMEFDNDFVLWFEPSDTHKMAMDRVKYMEGRHYIDRNTKTVTVNIMLFNPELASGIFTQVTMILEFNRAGLVDTNVVIESMFARPYAADLAMKLFCEISFCITLVYLTISEAKEVAFTAHKGWIHIFEYLSDFRNVLDWLNILVTVAVIIDWALLVFRVGDIENTYLGLYPPAQNVHNYTDAGREAWFNYHSDLQQLHADLCSGVAANIVSRNLIGFNLFLLTFRFVKCWHGIRELAMITETIMVMGKKLFFFTIIFVNIIVAYALTGMYAFGSRLEQFNSFVSTTNLLLAMFSDGGDGETLLEMEMYSPSLARFFYWSYVFIVFFLFFNMLLAIILDSYKKVQRDQETAIDLPILYYVKLMWKSSKKGRKTDKAGRRLPALMSIVEYLEQAKEAHDKKEESLRAMKRRGGQGYRHERKSVLMADEGFFRRGNGTGKYWAFPQNVLRRLLTADEVNTNIYLTDEYIRYLIVETRLHLITVSGEQPHETEQPHSEHNHMSGHHHIGHREHEHQGHSLSQAAEDCGL